MSIFRKGSMVVWQALVALVLISAGFIAAVADTPSSQKISAALERSMLPSIVPDFVQYAHGEACPVSQSDRPAGVIAYYVAAINFRATETTTALTYRVFRDDHAAARYANDLSVFDAPGFKPAPGFASFEDTKVADPNKWPGRRPYKGAWCDFFASTASPTQATARCSALHADLPVIVSGIQIQTVQIARHGERVTYVLKKDQKFLQLGYALELLDAGMVLLEDIKNTGR